MKVIKVLLRLWKRAKAFFIWLLICIFALINLQNALNSNIEVVDSVSRRIESGPVVWPPTSIYPTTKANVLDECKEMPNNLTNAIKIDLESLNSTEVHSIKHLKIGGWYKPVDCEARHRVAVIVPYRNRENQLKIFIRYIHPFLQRQQIDYRVYVLEQTQEGTFNKAVVMNTGFVEANKLYNYDCFIFHDVDLLPENDETRYTCEKSPVHLSVAIDSRNYSLPYRSSFGGVTGLSTEHFKKVNGFSNLYFGWGGEDDDMYERIKYSRLKISRLSQKVGRYKKLRHQKEKQSVNKLLLFKTIRARYLSDGLNSLRSHVVQQEFKPLYTWILVSVNETDIKNSEPIHKSAFKKSKNH